MNSEVIVPNSRDRERSVQFKGLIETINQLYGWETIPLVLKMVIPLIFTMNVLQVLGVVSPFSLIMDPEKILNHEQVVRRIFFWFLAVESVSAFLKNLIILFLIIPLYRKIQESYSSVYAFLKILKVHALLAKLNCLIWWIWTQFGPHSYSISGLEPFFVYCILQYSEIQDKNSQDSMICLPNRFSKYQKGLIVAVVFTVLSWQTAACMELILFFLLKRYACSCCRPKCFTWIVSRIQQCLPNCLKQRNDFTFLNLANEDSGQSLKKQSGFETMSEEIEPKG